MLVANARRGEIARSPSGKEMGRYGTSSSEQHNVHTNAHANAHAHAHTNAHAHANPHAHGQNIGLVTRQLNIQWYLNTIDLVSIPHPMPIPNPMPMPRTLEHNIGYSVVLEYN